MNVISCIKLFHRKYFFFGVRSSTSIRSFTEIDLAYDFLQFHEKMEKYISIFFTFMYNLFIKSFLLAAVTLRIGKYKKQKKKKVFF